MNEFNSREDLRNELTYEWQKLANLLIYPWLVDEEDEGDEKNEYGPDLSTIEISYEKYSELISKTKDYFNALPIKGSMSTEDFSLFETICTFRYLPMLFEPKEKKEEYIKVCTEVTEMLVSLESVSK